MQMSMIVSSTGASKWRFPAALSRENEGVSQAMRVHVWRRRAITNYSQILRLQEVLVSRHRSVDINNHDPVVSTIFDHSERKFSYSMATGY